LPPVDDKIIDCEISLIQANRFEGARGRAASGHGWGSSIACKRRVPRRTAIVARKTRRRPVWRRCYGIRFERRLCQEVELHLAYRWFCRLDLDDKVTDHSTFSVNRHGRFCDSNLLRLSSSSLASTPLAELPVLEVVSGVHIIADLTLGLGKVFYDHLRAG